MADSLARTWNMVLIKPTNAWIGGIGEIYQHVGLEKDPACDFEKRLNSSSKEDFYFDMVMANY